MMNNGSVRTVRYMRYRLAVRADWDNPQATIQYAVDGEIDKGEWRFTEFQVSEVHNPRHACTVVHRWLKQGNS